MPESENWGQVRIGVRVDLIDAVPQSPRAIVPSARAAQRARVRSAAVIDGRRAKPCAITRIVLISKEGRRAIVAALDQVQRLIRQEVTAKSRHRSTPGTSRHAACPPSDEKINSTTNGLEALYGALRRRHCPQSNLL